MLPSSAIDPPRRPSIPPVLLSALGLWLSCAIAYSAGQSLSRVQCVALAALGLAVAIAFACLLLRRRLAALTFALGFALGLSIGFAAAFSMHGQQEHLLDDTPYFYCSLVLRSDEMANAHGTSCEAEIRDGSYRGLDVRLLRSEPGESTANLLRTGDTVWARVKLSPPNESSETYFWQNGLVAQARAANAEKGDAAGFPGAMLYVRNTAIDRIENFLKGDANDSDSHDSLREHAAVVESLVCGYRVELKDSELYASYQVAGLAHLIAVSGAHLSIVCSLIARLLGMARVPRRIATALQIFLIGAYLVVAGMPVSGIRAAVMAACSLSSFYASRRQASCNSLGVCIICMLALHPQTAVSVSFALSAGSTLGIILFSGYLGAFGRVLFPRLGRNVSEALSLTLAAGLCTQLYSSSVFSQLSLISPFSNILAGPFFSIVCTGALLCSIVSVALPFAANAAVSLACALAGALNGAVRLLSEIPYACVPFSCSGMFAIGVSAAACAVLWMLWPFPCGGRRSGKTLPKSRKRIAAATACAAACACIAVLVFGSAFRADRIVALDVGQGDAILLQSRGERLLVDTGNRDSDLRAALARQHVWSVDSLAISHADDDHCGSLESISRTLRIGRILLSHSAIDCEDGKYRRLVSLACSIAGSDCVCGLKPGDEFSCGAFTVRTVWPDRFEDEGGNADSLCFLVCYDGDSDGIADCTVLLCGDAEADQVKQMVRQRRISQVDILKVGHHGSKASLDAELAAALHPGIALVSVGAGNRYGHPSDEVLQNLQAVGCTVLRTDEHGDLNCILSSDSVHVRTLR